MRISIFNLNSKSTYKEEYLKMIKVLSSKCVSFNKKSYTYFDYIDKYLFNKWKYRGTYLDLYSYLEFIGISIKSNKVTEESFINLLEFLLNIQLLIESIKYYNDNTIFNSMCQSVLFHNIPIILDKFGYQAYDMDDKVIILNKGLVYDDLLELVPDDIYEAMLSYRNINNNGIRMKKLILNKIYDYIITDIDRYKSYNSSIFTCIKTIVTKMGITGNIDKKYINLSNYKLKKYYDNCFEMMCYLINTKNIYKYREEIKQISN